MILITGLSRLIQFLINILKCLTRIYSLNTNTDSIMQSNVIQKILSLSTFGTHDQSRYLHLELFLI